MGPFDFSEPAVMQLMGAWLARSSELFAELYRPHSGGSGDFYAISSLSQARDLMARAPRGAVLFVLRDEQLQIRGVVDDDLISRALGHLGDAEPYLIVEPCAYPDPLALLGDGQSHAELIEELDELRGVEVWLGPALAMPDDYSKANPDEGALIAIKGGS
ncbi:MAG: hypothetical protein JXR96_07495 [Deltaproteobacteria bacterium]|nr:hypothetical protein [Deltaproteobacteria bacterium]